MPITGFLEGFNEQQKAMQTLEDQRQLAGLRATEIAANVNKLQTDFAVKSKLAEIFTGAPSGPPDPNATQDDVLADKLNRAGTAILAVDPAKGLAFTNAAANIQQRKALANKEKLDSDIKARDEQGGYLSAMKDQDTYDTLLPKALQAGWKLPSWFTGDWAKDGPRVAAEAAGTMKASEQATVQKNLAEERLKLSNQQRLNDVAQANIQFKDIQQTQAQQRIDATKRRNDRIASDQRERLNRMALPGDNDFRAAKTAFEARDDTANIGDKAKKEIINRVAADAKRTALRNDTDIEDEIDKSLNRILSEDTVDTKIETQLFGITIPGMTKPGKALKPRAAAPAARIDASGGEGQLPKVGEVRRGYRFKGGDPSKPTSWEKV